MVIDQTLEQQEIMQVVKKITKEKIMPRAAEVDRTDEFPHDLVKVLGENGLLTMCLPEKYGGIEANSSLLAMVIEELSKGLASMGTTMLSTNSVIRMVSLMARPDQLDKFYANLSSGHKLCAFCLTESHAGSDARAISTSAKKALQGGYILNGTKIFVTLSQVAEYYLVFAKTNPDEISAFLVHKDSPGLHFGKIENKMGLHGSSTGDVILEDCWVADDALIGQEGDGWRMLSEIGTSMLRSWGAAAMALGVGQCALDFAIQYAKERKQFNKRIGDFQAIRFMLADCAMQLEAARCLVRETNRRVDQEYPVISKETTAMVSMSKCLATDVAMKVTTDAVQIFGGYGYIKEYPVERLMRDAKIFQIVDGTNQVQRMIIGSILMK
ncbi:acyl-CoA dehydrogenase family protein [Fodinisporobacter ferrooxydans]|uniref:Acyl-CoA dehydrogenase family protein n=1 Tax=Fodinisporobacter ferrooxydans TaxID=2901836 RepID=A0ABY4CNX5_9BACL|nr:acyl-CoA dehydrogenase family protein [Alicyclobacillaceae bacterium MYW30-H2]